MGQCACGSPHRKPTLLLTNAPFLPELRCAEAPVHSHVTLSGKVWSYKLNEEVWYTAEAAEYPWGMCQLWAKGCQEHLQALDRGAEQQPVGIRQDCDPMGRPHSLRLDEDPTAREIRDEENAQCIGGLRDPHAAL